MIQMKANLWVSGYLLAGILATAGTGRAEVVGSLFNPVDYTTGSGFNIHLNLGSTNTLTIYTGTSTANPWYSLDGGTNKHYGAKVSNQNNTVQLAVFCFDQITIDGATINITGGNLGLVLGSRGGFTFSGSTIDVSGASRSSASQQTGGAGGPGAEGGVRKTNYNSAPPDGDRGDGGDANQGWLIGGDGLGYGGGGQLEARVGAGGGYGGRGGEPDKYSGAARDASQGAPYGNAPLSNLYGGSGGAASFRTVSTGGNYYAGGGGGGSIALIARGAMTLGGSILANGGAGGLNGGDCGGGGSGGGILIGALSITISGANVDAKGGYSGGGGGRVAMYAHRGNITGLQGNTVEVTGADNHCSYEDGANGSFRYSGDGGSPALTWPWPPPAGTVIVTH